MVEMMGDCNTPGVARRVNVLCVQARFPFLSGCCMISLLSDASFACVPISHPRRVNINIGACTDGTHPTE